MFEVYIHKIYNVCATKIETNCPTILDSIISYYSEYIINGAQEYDILKIIKSKDKYKVFFGTKQIESTDPMSDLDMILRTKEIDERYFVMHSGGIVFNNKAILFSAPTSRGKSTIITFLTNKGMTYISDDNIVIDISSKKVIPFYKPILLRESSMEILRGYGINIPTIFRGAQSMKRVIWNPPKSIEQPTEIGRILIPQISDVNKIERLPKELALDRLIMSAIKPYRPTTKIMSFLNQLSTFECYVVRFNNLDYIYHSISNASFDR